jgi:hypothetical protein
MTDNDAPPAEGSWLIEWDGGFDTADSEAEAWEKVDALIAKWGDATRDEFLVRPNAED